MGCCVCKLYTDDHAQATTKDYEVIDTTLQKETLLQPISPESSNDPQISYQQALSGSTIARKPVGQTTMKLKPEMLVRKQSIYDKFLSHYEIIRKLGQGGFGEVYLVRQISTKNIRAAKMILRKSISCEEKLLEETDILMTLDHPNIMKILEIFSDMKYYYLVTEYCEGGELLQRIRTVTNYNEKLTAQYMKQIFSALIYCHFHKIVHRDLKPENILFDSRESKANLKVIDFGASEKMIDQSKLTTKVGTPYYVAPEVLKDESYDEKVDVWSCGVILYMLLSGRPPFKGVNDIDTLKQARTGKYDLISDRWRTISSDAKDLIQRMIVVDPKNRITMAEAFNHPWICNNNENNLFDDQGLLKNLCQFSAQNKLRAAIYQFISIQLISKEESKALFTKFKALDKNGDGVLCKEELLQGIVNTDIDSINAEFMVNEIMLQLDVNDSGKVDFIEFISAALVQQQKITLENIRNAFRIFDIDNNGSICKAEFEEVFGGIEIDVQIWDDILLKFDSNKDGVIEEEEFISLLQNIEF